MAIGSGALRQILILAVIILLCSPLSIAEQDPLRELSQEAQQAMQQRDFDTAIKLYRQLLEQRPGLTGARLQLGIALFMSQQFNDAVSELDQTLQEDASLVPGWFFLGAGLFQLGNLEEAESALEKYVEKQPSDPQGWHMLGNVLMARGDYASAARVFQKLSETAPESAPAWYQLGKAYEAAAHQAFSELEEIAPESGYWLALVADSRVAQQQYRSAFYFYRKALEKTPQLRGVHSAVSRVYRLTGHQDWAQKEARKEEALGAPDCQKEPILCAFLAGEFERVLELADSNEAKALYWKIQAYNHLARKAFQHLSQLPASFEQHRFKAEVHQTQGRHLEAAQEWRKALSLSPEHPEAERGLAFSLFLGRDYTGSEPLISRLLEREPDDPQIHYAAGEIRLNQEKPKESVPFFERTLELDPDFLQAHASLGRAYLSLEKPESAVRHLQQALPLDRDGSLHYQLAQAYRQAGKMEEAARVLDDYRRIQQREQDVQDQLEAEAEIVPPEEEKPQSR